MQTIKLMVTPQCSMCGERVVCKPNRFNMMTLGVRDGANRKKVVNVCEDCLVKIVANSIIGDDWGEDLE